MRIRPLCALLCVLLTPLLAAAEPHVVLISIDGLAASYLDDPQASLPTIRRLAKEGTRAEGMRPINPVVTWPNHTTLVTGVRADKHSVFFNGVLERSAPGKPVRVVGDKDRAALVAVPTLFDHLKKAGLRSAAINWPCTRGSDAIDDNFADVPRAVATMSPRLRDRLVETGVMTEGTDKWFGSIGPVRRDDAWTAAAVRVIEDSKPAFVALHLLNGDYTQHVQGPHTNPVYTSLALADVKVGEVLAALDRAGIRADTTVIVCADHGFAKGPKMVLPNVVFRQNKLLTAGPTGIVAAKAQALPAGGTAMIYLTDPATIDDDRRKVVELLKAAEGVADVIEPARYPEIGFPAPEKNRQAPDLIAVAKEGYAFADYATGDEAVIEPVLGRHKIGHHGFMNTDPRMNAIFVAAGRGIRAGAKVGVIENVNVAPTIAKLLDVDLPSADGKALEEVLVR